MLPCGVLLQRWWIAPKAKILFSNFIALLRSCHWTEAQFTPYSSLKSSHLIAIFVHFLYECSKSFAPPLSFVLFIHVCIYYLYFAPTGSNRFGPGRVYAAGLKGNGKRAFRALLHQDVQEDGIVNSQQLKGGRCTRMMVASRRVGILSQHGSKVVVKCIAV